MEEESELPGKGSCISEVGSTEAAAGPIRGGGGGVGERVLGLVHILFPGAEMHTKSWYANIISLSSLPSRTKIIARTFLIIIRKGKEA